MSVPTIVEQGGVYQLNWRDEHIEIRVDRVHTDKSGVHGELLIRTSAPGFHPHIHGPVLFNFISSTTRRQLVNHLKEVAPLDWLAIMEQLCIKIVDAHRTGEEAVNIADHAMPEHLGMRINPILQERQATLFFGEGDSLKSFLATYLVVLTRLGIPATGLTPEPGNVLYLDWETDVDTFWERVNMITAGLGRSTPEGIYYRPMVDTLHAEFTRINQVVTKQGIELIVIDSAAPATLEPEKAETVTQFFKALRSLKTTSLIIAHKAKNAKGESPFGSAFWINLPRSIFSIKADRNQGDVAMSLKHTKSNNSPRLQPVGFQFSFKDDAVIVSKANAADYSDLSKDVPLIARIKDLLGRQGVMDYREIADALGEPQGTVKVRLSEGSKSGALINISGKWGIRHSEPDWLQV